MSSLIEQIEAAYAARSMRQVTVPEWGITFNVWPMTIKQMSLIQAESDPFMRALKAIQVRGKTESGLQILDAATVERLANRGTGPFGPDVVFRVAREIMADDVSAEEVAKN